MSQHCPNKYRHSLYHRDYSDRRALFSFFFYPGSNSLYVEDNLELLIPLPLPPTYWDCKSMPPCPACTVPFEILLSCPKVIFCSFLWLQNTFACQLSITELLINSEHCGILLHSTIACWSLPTVCSSIPPKMPPFLHSASSSIFFSSWKSQHHHSYSFVSYHGSKVSPRAQTK